MSDTPTRYADRDRMKARKGGDYVAYEDYEKLEQRLAKAIEQRDRAMEIIERRPTRLATHNALLLDILKLKDEIEKEAK